MEDNRVLSAKVRIDKPTALRFAKTVSVEMSDRRGA
jgi:dihydroneopterin aldolase